MVDPQSGHSVKILATGGKDLPIIGFDFVPNALDKNGLRLAIFVNEKGEVEKCEATEYADDLQA
jgi:hypothetical protein